MKYILILFIFIGCTDTSIDEPICSFHVHTGAVKEIIIDLQSYELGDEWIELTLYRDGVFQSKDRQFNTAEFSEAQKLTYRLRTDGLSGKYRVTSDRPFMGVILNIKKVN